MAKSENASFNIWSRHYIAIIAANFFVASCMNFHTAVTTLYVVSLGGTESYAGILLTCFTFAGFFMRIISGKLLEKRTRRMIISTGLIIYAAATAALTIPWLPQLPVSRAIQAIGYSMASTGLTVAVTDVLPRNRLNEGIGYSGLIESISSAAGPGIALGLYNLAGNYASVYYVSIVMMAVAFVILAVSRYEKDTQFFDKKNSYEAQLPQEDSIKAEVPVEEPEENRGLLSRWFEKKALPSMITAVFYSIAMSAKIAYLVLFAQRIGIDNPGLFYTLEAAAMVFVRLICGKLADRFGALSVLIPAFLCMIISYSMIAFAQKELWMFYPAGVLSGLGSGIIFPTLNAQAVKNVTGKRRGTAVATYMIAFDLGIGLGGLFWGKVLESVGFRPVFLGCVCCVTVSLVLSLLFFSKKNKKAQMA